MPLKAPTRYKPKAPKKIMQKVATGALIGATAVASTAYFGKKLNTAIRPITVNMALDYAHGNNLSEIKSVGQRITELNRLAEAKSLKLHLDKRKLYYYDEKNSKIASVIIDKVKAKEIEAKQAKNFERLDRLIEKKVTSLNHSAKPTEIYFWDGNKISKIDLDVAVLGKLYKKLYTPEREELDRIYSELVKELRTNDKFSTEVVQKMKKELSDTTRAEYLATLSVEEFVQRFGGNPKLINRLSNVLKSLEQYKENPDPKKWVDSREVLLFVQQDVKTQDMAIYGALGVINATALALLYSKAKLLLMRKGKRKSRK